MPKMHQNMFGGRVPPGAPQNRPTRNRWAPTSKERDISIDWPQDGDTSLKYKAQRERSSQ